MLLRRPRLLPSFCLLLVGAGLFVACGGRSAVYSEDRETPEEPPPPECTLDLECDQSNLCAPQGCIEGSCAVLGVIDCGPAPECHSNSCNPLTGGCELQPLTFDLDADGQLGPLPGTVPGAPGSCGTDCDDTNPLAYAGGVEACDGADNDCDGIIDNGARYVSFDDENIPDPVFVPGPEITSSGRRGIAFGDGVFALGYWGDTGSFRPYLRGLDVNGNEAFAERLASEINGPTFGPSLTWSGNSFAAVWDDPRVDDNYEIYFARFDSLGNKLGPDLRITEADDFSIHGRTIFDQWRFVVVWDDRRNEETLGVTHLMAQLVDEKGEKIGDNVQLSSSDESAEYPYIAATPSRYGVAYQVLQDDAVGLRFRVFDKALSAITIPTVLQSEFARGARVVAAGDVFVVTWETYDGVPGPSILGAVVGQEGQLLAGPMALTTGAGYARSHGVLSLGDRVLLVWSDTFDGEYELYAKMLDTKLSELEPRRRLTNADGDSLGAEVALGDNGQVGIFFDDWRSGKHQTYFMTLGCEPARL